MEHFEKMIQFYGERGAIMFRKNLHAYAKGHEGASEFRHLVNSLNDVDVIRAEIEQFFSHHQMVSQDFPQLIHLNKRTS